MHTTGMDSTCPSMSGRHSTALTCIFVNFINNAVSIPIKLPHANEPKKMTYVWSRVNQTWLHEQTDGFTKLTTTFRNGAERTMNTPTASIPLAKVGCCTFIRSIVLHQKKKVPFEIRSVSPSRCAIIARRRMFVYARRCQCHRK